MAIAALMIGTAGPAAARVSTTSHHQLTEAAIKKARTDNGRPTLAHDTCLDKYAASWAKVIAKKGKLVHRSTTSLRKVLKACKKRSIGENLAMGTDNYMGTGALVTAAWMNSPGHRANILNSKFTHQGVGSYWDGKRWWIASLLAQR